MKKTQKTQPKEKINKTASSKKVKTNTSTSTKNKKETIKVKTSQKKEITKPIPVVPEVKQLTFLQEQFLEILRQMFMSGRPISHMLFNGIFRLPNNRLYEFSDEEIVKAFNTQLSIMERKREREISIDSKNQKCRELL